MKKIAFFLLTLFCAPIFLAQVSSNDDSDLEPEERKTKFLIGLYVGSYFANKYSASTYDGYGFDINGQKNPFFGSWMHQKIINEYGGGYGQHDQIAEALGVDQGQWTFGESDMAVNMRYTPAILVGAHFKIPVSKRSSFLVNFSGTKIGVEGNFTINTIRPPNPNPAITSTVQTFAIRGVEQRFQFQLGFQQLFGKDDKFNFLLEPGLIGTLSKLDKNTIYINTLTIELTQYVNQALYPAPNPTKNPIGFGVGAFLGMGINLDVSPKFIVQLIYTLSFEKVNIGTAPTLKLQHGIGFRIYYKL